MTTWINELLSSEHPSAMVLVAVFVMGMVSVVTCACNFAVIGVVAGYSGASSQETRTRTVIFRGLAFLIGGVISMGVIGTLFGYAGQWISDSFGNYWRIAAGVIAIFFGLYSMDLVPFKLPGLTLKPSQSGQNIFSAILFGLAVGGLSTALSSCCNPLFPVILAASFVKGSALWGLMMLTSFSLGYGLPLASMMVGLSLGIGKVSKTLTTVGTIVKYVGGISLVLLGFYFLLTI
ncbi:MAG: cytochrome c biogenesis CcdA family protein [Bacteroidales bacterium]